QRSVLTRRSQFQCPLLLRIRVNRNGCKLGLMRGHRRGRRSPNPCRIYSGEYMLWLGYWEDTSVLAMISLRHGLGLVIAKRRKAAGLAQEEFAFQAKVHRTYMTG